MFKWLLCVYILVTVVNFYGSADALQCHVCRNCPEVSDDTLQTCPSRPVTPQTTVPPTTDTTGSGDTDGTTENEATENITTDSAVTGRIDTENEIAESVPTVIVVPGDEEKNQYIDFAGMNAPQRVFLRTLKQTRDDEEVDEPSCLKTTFEENNTTVYVRACAFASDDPQDSCASAAGEITGPLLSCLVCTEDGCNAASTTTSTLAILAIGLIVNLKKFFV